MDEKTGDQGIKQAYEWVNCPHCRQRLFRHVRSKKFDIEAPCNHCKGIWRIYSIENNGTGFEQVRAPKFSYVPIERKKE